MAAPCQESEGEALYREECVWQSALDGRASDVDWISCVWAPVLNNCLYERGDLESYGLC